MRSRINSYRCVWTWVFAGATGLALAAGGCASAKRGRSPMAVRQSAVSTPLAVSPDDYRAHIAVLASDTLEGRGIGTRGIDQAAAYIAGEFALIGIEPGGVDGTYFQPFEVATGADLTDDYAFTFTGASVEPKREDDYIPFTFSTNDAFDGDVEFVGYGLVSEEHKHDDYAGIDVTGDVVLMLRREPPDWSGGRGFSRLASFENKISTAKEHGAVAVLVVNQATDDRDRLMPFGRSMGGGGDYGLPAFHITKNLAGDLLEAGGLPPLEELQEKVDANEVASGPLKGVHLRGRAGIEPETVLIRNVIGRIGGEGRLANEYVVIGGHYDHLGIARPMSIFRRGRGGGGGEPQIHNGADDNASGTAGVIEAGRMLVRQEPLKRSVLLMAFTGEETGLHGSRYFVNHPTVPLENIVAMLNMDMIGRLDPEDKTLEVYGTKAADEFEDMVERLVADAGMELIADESALGPSDHMSFYQKKIPSIHFFTGLHEDYHQPTDDIEKVSFEGGARVTDLVVAMADEIINADQRPTYHEVTERANIFRGQFGQQMASAPRVRIGIMPGYASSGGARGMLVEGVLPGGPAAEAGMEDGDRIVKIGDSEVNDITDMMASLQDNKPGDVVKFVVVRAEKEVPLDVTLAAR